MEDCITKEEAIQMLRKQEPFKKEREIQIAHTGFPAYTTSVGWLGYPDEKIQKLSQEFMAKGFTAFKMKVGSDLEDDKRRLRCIVLRSNFFRSSCVSVFQNLERQHWS